MTLREFFEQNRSAALAFSGGADSAYLLYAGIRFGCDICAYYVKSEFQPQFELEDAKHLAGQLGARLKIIELSVLEDDSITENSPLRCYFCKRRLFSAIVRQTRQDGYSVVIDGTNASDDSADRPGIRALRELCVLSPLRQCGLTKDEIRRLSRQAGLFTWNKPAYACLATRLAAGTEITKKALQITEAAENELFAMGFRDFRIRRVGNTAKLQLPPDQLARLLSCRSEVVKRLKPYYDSITLDLEVRA